MFNFLLNLALSDKFRLNLTAMEQNMKLFIPMINANITYDFDNITTYFSDWGEKFAIENISNASMLGISPSKFAVAPFNVSKFYVYDFGKAKFKAGVVSTVPFIELSYAAHDFELYENYTIGIFNFSGRQRMVAMNSSNLTQQFDEAIKTTTGTYQALIDAVLFVNTDCTAKIVKLEANLANTKDYTFEGQKSCKVLKLNTTRGSDFIVIDHGQQQFGIYQYNPSDMSISFKYNILKQQFIDYFKTSNMTYERIRLFDQDILIARSHFQTFRGLEQFTLQFYYLSDQESEYYVVKKSPLWIMSDGFSRVYFGMSHEANRMTHAFFDFDHKIKLRADHTPSCWSDPNKLSIKVFNINSTVNVSLINKENCSFAFPPQNMFYVNNFGNYTLGRGKNDLYSGRYEKVSTTYGLELTGIYMANESINKYSRNLYLDFFNPDTTSCIRNLQRPQISRFLLKTSLNVSTNCSNDFPELNVIINGIRGPMSQISEYTPYNHTIFQVELNPEIFGRMYYYMTIQIELVNIGPLTGEKFPQKQLVNAKMTYNASSCFGRGDYMEVFFDGVNRIYLRPFWQNQTTGLACDNGEPDSFEFKVKWNGISHTYNKDEMKSDGNGSYYIKCGRKVNFNENATLRRVYANGQWVSDYVTIITKQQPLPSCLEYKNAYRIKYHEENETLYTMTLRFVKSRYCDYNNFTIPGSNIFVKQTVKDKEVEGGKRELNCTNFTANPKQHRYEGRCRMREAWPHMNRNGKIKVQIRESYTDPDRIYDLYQNVSRTYWDYYRQQHTFDWHVWREVDVSMQFLVWLWVLLGLVIGGTIIGVGVWLGYRYRKEISKWKIWNWFAKTCGCKNCFKKGKRENSQRMVESMLEKNDGLIPKPPTKK